MKIILSFPPWAKMLGNRVAKRKEQARGCALARDSNWTAAVSVTVIPNLLRSWNKP
jgi:hypothetical protein